MVATAVLLLSSLLVAAVLGNREDEARLLDRLDLKNYKKFADLREHSSSDSSDSSSDAKRIARAVEAALKEAELADKFTPAPSGTPNGAKPFRLRLSTVNKAHTCDTFDCADVDASADSASILNGVTVIVQTTNGTFTGAFNASGIAVDRNDLFQFLVTAEVDDGVATFTLSTTQGLFGVNITSITIGTQPLQTQPARSVLVYFDPFGGDASGAFWDPTTNGSIANPDIVIKNITTTPEIIGCDGDFDGPNPSKDGITTFIVFNSTANSTLVTNTNPTPFVFQVRVLALNVSTERAAYAHLGFLPLPCGSRGRVIYDEIAIVTERENTIGFGDDTLEHPLIYDVLKSTTQSATPSFDNFIHELQLAAGRTQLRLQSITLDRGAFSDLSHHSKFTPCFRIYPDEDGKIEVFIGMRSANGGGLVRAVLHNADGQFVQGNQVRTFAQIDASHLANFQTTEIVFSSLGLPLNFAEVEGTDQRPFIQLDSDVTVQLEDCPTFSYFS
jgi:hypothetical protein